MRIPLAAVLIFVMALSARSAPAEGAHPKEKEPRRKQEKPVPPASACAADADCVRIRSVCDCTVVNRAFVESVKASIARSRGKIAACQGYASHCNYRPVCQHGRCVLTK